MSDKLHQNMILNGREREDEADAISAVELPRSQIKHPLKVQGMLNHVSKVAARLSSLLV